MPKRAPLRHAQNAVSKTTIRTYDNALLVKTIGPVHGVVFVVYVIIALGVAVELRWKSATTGKVLLASFIPFGTFYINKTILRKETSA